MIHVGDPQKSAVISEQVDKLKEEWLTIYRLLMRKTIRINGEYDGPLLTQILFEFALFRRLLYKNKNQHRAAKYYQHLDHVKRLSRSLIERLLITNTESSESLVDSVASAFNQLGFEFDQLHLPAADCANNLLGEGKNISDALQTLLETTQKAYVTLQTHLIAPGYFLPFATVMMAWCARWHRLLLVVKSILDSNLDKTQEFLETLNRLNLPGNETWLRTVCCRLPAVETVGKQSSDTITRVELDQEAILANLASSATPNHDISAVEKSELINAPELPTSSSTTSTKKRKKKSKPSSSMDIIDDLFANIKPKKSKKS